MDLLVLPVNANNDVYVLHHGRQAVVAGLAMRLPPGTGAIKCVVAWQAF